MNRAVEFLRRAVTDLFSMTPWPLEAAGTFILWHYGSLFSSNQVLSRDYRSIIAQIMPNDTWGLFARSVAYSLCAICLVTWLSRKSLYSVRTLMAVLGLLVWGVLVYSCWRTDVPIAIYRLYIFFLGAQTYTGLLIRFRRRAHEGTEKDVS